MELGSLASLLSVGLGLILGILGVIRYVTAQVDSLRREIKGVQDTNALIIGKAIDSEANIRMVSNNQTNILLAKFESDLRILQRDTVRQDQLSAMEQRLQAGVSKLDVKVDKLAEVGAEVVSMRNTLINIAMRIEKVQDRLEGKNSV